MNEALAIIVGSTFIISIVVGALWYSRKIRSPQEDLSLASRRSELKEVENTISRYNELELSGNPFGFKVPSPTDHLYGREESLEVIREIIQEERFINITGVEGIGKTRLSIQLAHVLKDHFPDGLVFLPISGIRSPKRFIARFNEYCTKDFSNFKDIVEAIQNNRILLFLDDLSPNGELNKLIQLLLDSCPNLKLVATSRNTSGSSYETQYQLPELTVPEVPEGKFDLELLVESPCIKLYLETLRNRVPDLEISSNHVVEIVKICNELNGHPGSVIARANQVNKAVV